MTDYGKHCVESGMEDLTDQAECESALSFAQLEFPNLAKFTGPGFYSTYPKGCFVNAGSMYFNTHDTGRVHSGYKCICKTGKHIECSIISKAPSEGIRFGSSFMI